MYKTVMGVLIDSAAVVERYFKAGDPVSGKGMAEIAELLRGRW
jgi:hypothetical protein